MERFGVELGGWVEFEVCSLTALPAKLVVVMLKIEDEERDKFRLSLHMREPARPRAKTAIVSI